jgi:hypothetical protein
MRRSTNFLAILMLAVAVTLLLADLSTAEAGGGNCQDKLVGNFYNCTGKESSGMSPSGCITFETGGLSSNFDLVAGSTHYGCACDTTGSFSSPSFDDSSSAFECVSDEISINGKVKSKKISSQIVIQSGLSEVLSCTERSSPCP